jgi:hypothetical protein
MAVERKRLADYGLNTERLLMEKRGRMEGEPWMFEISLGGELLDRLSADGF